MINTVLQVIERFESSSEFESSQLPASIYDGNEADDTSILIDTEEDTSDESDEYKDAEESSASEEIKFPANPALIKQTLKDKIRIRRESEGAGEFLNLFEPPRQYKLTPEEEVKNEIRKHRNRRSATKSRLKRIAREQQLEKDAVNLEAENEKRTQEVNTLKKVKLIYSLILKKHLSSCPRAAAASNSSISTQSNAHNAQIDTPTVPATCVANGMVGNNSLVPSLRSSLAIPKVNTPTNVVEQLLRQSSQNNWPIKRSSADEINELPIKTPKILPQTEMAMSRLVNTGPATCQSNMFSELWNNTTVSPVQTSNSVQSTSMTTVMGINSNVARESVLCEIPSTFTSNIQQPVLATNTTQVHSPFESEEQKINQIKQHLLDDFPMTSHR